MELKRELLESWEETPYTPSDPFFVDSNKEQDSRPLVKYKSYNIHRKPIIDWEE